MPANSNTPESIVRQAEALIEQVQGQLEAQEQFYRSQGLNPEKVRAVLQEQLTPEAQAQAEQAFANDMAAVEQETREETARLSFTTAVPTTSLARRSRHMV